MTYTKIQIKEMRDWCLDCQMNDEDLERVNNSSDQEIIKLIERNYHNGMTGFLADSVPVDLKNYFKLVKLKARLSPKPWTSSWKESSLVRVNFAPLNQTRLRI